MDTFKVVGLITTDKLSSILKMFEKHQIPYNVELSKERVGAAVEKGSLQAAVLEALKTGPMKPAAIAKVISAQGFSAKSASNAIHLLKKAKVIKNTAKGYELAK